MQHAAMRGIDGHSLAPAQTGQPGIKAALGAMAVQHVDVEGFGQFTHRQRRDQIAPTQHARHIKAMDAQRHMRRQFSQPAFGLRVIGQTVDHQANTVPMVTQFSGEVGDVAKQAAHWRSHYLQNAQLSSSHGRPRQNQRSVITMVSPG